MNVDSIDVGITREVVPPSSQWLGSSSASVSTTGVMGKETVETWTVSSSGEGVCVPVEGNEMVDLSFIVAPPVLSFVQEWWWHHSKLNDGRFENPHWLHLKYLGWHSHQQCWDHWYPEHQ